MERKKWMSHRLDGTWVEDVDYFVVIIVTNSKISKRVRSPAFVKNGRGTTDNTEAQGGQRIRSPEKHYWPWKQQVKTHTMTPATSSARGLLPWKHPRTSSRHTTRTESLLLRYFSWEILKLWHQWGNIQLDHHLSNSQGLELAEKVEGVHGFTGALWCSAAICQMWELWGP